MWTQPRSVTEPNVCDSGTRIVSRLLANDLTCSGQESCLASGPIKCLPSYNLTIHDKLSPDYLPYLMTVDVTVSRLCWPQPYGSFVH